MRTVKKKITPSTTITGSSHHALSLKDLLLVCCVVCSWGVAFTGMKQMVNYAPPITAAGLRFFLGSLPLVFLALQPKRLRLLKLADFGKLMLLGFFQTTLVFGINFFALTHVSAGLSSIILNTNPFFVAILAHFMISGDKLTPQKVAGLLVGFSGVCILVLGGKGVGEVALYWPLLILLGAVAWGFSSILVKKFQFKDMISLTAWQTFFGSLPLLALGFTFEQKPIDLNFTFIFWTAYAALIATSFAWWLWYKLLSRYSASQISIFLFLSPVCGVISGVLILGESLGLNQVLGGILVATGIGIVNLRMRLRRIRINNLRAARVGTNHNLIPEAEN
ncbi:MAG TPA: DMT family transporter [Chloroflexia bacterium]|nr:DMT family transporter [Chloroflexia bacterium]